jgi:hypothetical protein
LFQKPDVVFAKEPDVVDAVAEHGGFKMAGFDHGLKQGVNEMRLPSA